MTCMAKKRTKDEWVIYLNNIHNNKYDYTKTNFTSGVMIKNIVTCFTHGDWSVTLDNHSTKKSGCPKCIGRHKTDQEWIDKFNKQWNNIYDYSLNKNINSNTKLNIICSTHGIFKKDVFNHIGLNPQGCPNCINRWRKKIPIDKLESNARKLHFNDYEYKWEEYINYYIPITIICKKHGEFKQSIANHNQGQGCPNCKRSIGELKIRQWLINNNIKFTQQYKFEDCKNNRCLPFDFYLPNYNTCIEFDGEQHFKLCKIFEGINSFQKIQQNDQIKNLFCQENNISLIRISYKEIKQIHEKLCNLMLTNIETSS